MPLRVLECRYFLSAMRLRRFFWRAVRRPTRVLRFAMFDRRKMRLDYFAIVVLFDIYYYYWFVGMKTALPHVVYFAL